MCRTGTRHCRGKWTVTRRAIENVQRRVARNTAKAQAARDVGNETKALAYDQLAEAARSELAAHSPATPAAPVAEMTPEQAHAFLTEDLIRRYTLGDCGVLAHHLAVRNGWGVCVVGTLDYTEFDEDYPEDSYVGVETLMHAYAVRPDGALVDVRGVHPSTDADALARDRGQTRHDYPDADSADRLWNHEQWLDTDWGDPDWNAVNSAELATWTATAVTSLYADAAPGTHHTLAPHEQSRTGPVEVYDSSGDLCALTPGVIDDEADWVYRNGQCLALAVAISERTGWPVHLRTMIDGDPADPAGTYPNLRHAYVQAPDGTLVDVRGEHDADIVEEECRDLDGDLYLPARVVPAAQARALLGEFEGFLFDQDLDAARMFVDPVLLRVAEVG